jgi:uncharacterized protein (DUF58 family)
VPAARHRPFPLVARRRVAALSAGGQRSVYRGPGSEIVGARPYRPGDRLSTIDWRASARLGTALDEDVFVVREHAADVSARAVVVTDRSPSNGVAASAFAKPRAVREAAEAVALSVAVAHGVTGFLDVGARSVRWRPPRPGTRVPEAARFEGPADGVEQALAHLRRSRAEAPAGTFVFVCSDFLAPPGEAAWRHALAQGWDVVPVVAQDPVWERSFPAVGGLLLPVLDLADGRVRGVRLSRREAAARRAANERRFAELLRGFAALRLDPVVLDGSDVRSVDAAFHAWAGRRR